MIVAARTAHHRVFPRIYQLTRTVDLIEEWMVQTYVKVPALVNFFVNR
jgi:hypothetical protein